MAEFLLAHISQLHENDAQPFLQADPPTAVRLSQTLGRSKDAAHSSAENVTGSAI